MWYVMKGTRYGWEPYLGPFECEADAQKALRDHRHTTINALCVMKTS